MLYGLSTANNMRKHRFSLTALSPKRAESYLFHLTEKYRSVKSGIHAYLTQ